MNYSNNKNLEKVNFEGSDNLVSFFRGKDIVVTGGCGSIGSEIVAQLLKFEPKRIRIFDSSESGLFEMQQRFKSNILRFLVGNIRDKQRLSFAVENADIVFHAAALKHVPLCEYNPFEAVSTNVIGTQNLVEVCRSKGVKKLVSISTDKAVNPINTMGATKLLAEKIVLTGRLGDNCKTKFSCVRFGNVLNSVGSVIPIFMKQIKEGGPVTITSLEMVRYFMTKSQAVGLVLKAAFLTDGDEIFILKMKKLKIVDLAEVMIEKYSRVFGHERGIVSIKEIGVRPGEKIDEHLLTIEEKERMFDMGDLVKVHKAKEISFISQEQKNLQVKNFEHNVLLSKEEIGKILDGLSLDRVYF